MTEYKKSNNETFVNPYNFVGIDLKNKPTNDIEEVDNNNGLTGWIEYSILAKTPLAIPDAERVTSNTEGHKAFPFMRRPDQENGLMIPGSALRGAIRNVFETATDSCFSTYKENMFITARQGAIKGEKILPGLLEIKKDAEGKTEYTLFEADYYMLKTRNYNNNKSEHNALVWDEKKSKIYKVEQDKNGKYIKHNGKNYYSGDKVRFNKLLDSKGEQVLYVKTQRTNRAYPCGKVASELVGDSGIEGTLVLGEHIFNKHHDRIFVKGKQIDLEQEKIGHAYEGLKKTLDIYRDNAINKSFGKDHTGYASFERMKEYGRIPLYYKFSSDHKNIYFQLAAVGRIAFENDMFKLVGAKKPCSDREKVCPACALFGMVGDDNNSIGSRIRFEDAISIESIRDLKKYTLQELSAPKASFVRFYSNMTEDDSNDAGYDDEHINIRGRKFYWHHIPNKKTLKAKENLRNATMELAEVGTVFKGKIYFDQIMDNELKKLIWSLNFWENDPNGDYCHKIGHGKPLGFGSVKIIVDHVMTRSFKTGVYKISEYENAFSDKEPVATTDTVKNLKKICNFNTVENEKVTYPYIILEQGSDNKVNKNATAAFNWFREAKNNNMILPLIENENQELPPFEIVKSFNRGKRKPGKKRW